jgi:hypothetical protein
MLRFADRPDALPLNLIWNFETTSNCSFVYAINTPVSSEKKIKPGLKFA